MTEPHDAPPPPAAASGSPDVGRLVEGRYRLAEVIGTGGMATVHRALDTKLGRTVAIKLLRREAIEDPDIAMRFRREALAATVLRHPNIIACLETGTDRGQPYLVMELIEGEDLAARLHRVGRLTPPEAARIGLDVARALSVAHVRGIVHRDVKPGNILLARDGRAMVTDFGIARLAADTEGAVPGTTLGSVHYFSPEQATGATTTPASDVYSLGLVLFEMLTGGRAWSGDSTASLATARVGSPAPSPRDVRPDVPSSLDAIVRRALDPDPGRRYENGNAIAVALEPLVARPDPATRTDAFGPVVVAAAAPPAPAPVPTAAPPLRPASTPASARTGTSTTGRTAVRRASPAIAGPLVVLVAVAAVVAGGLLIAARPNPADPARIAVASATPRPTRAPTTRPTTAPDPTPEPAAATPRPDPTAKPQLGSVPNLCEPFFGIACGLDKGTYSPAVFNPAIQFTIGEGWAAATVTPDLISLSRDTGVMTFAGSIGTVFPTGDPVPAPATARGLVETFIGTDGVAAGKPRDKKIDKHAGLAVDLAPTGPERIALFATRDQTFYLEADGTTRFFIIDAGDTVLVIAIEPTADATIEAVLSAASPIVNSVRFR